MDGSSTKVGEISHACMHTHVCTHMDTPFPAARTQQVQRDHHDQSCLACGAQAPPQAQSWDLSPSEDNSEQSQAKKQYLLPSEGASTGNSHLVLSGDRPLMLRKELTPADRMRKDLEGWWGWRGLLRVPSPATSSDTRACLRSEVSGKGQWRLRRGRGCRPSSQDMWSVHFAEAGPGHQDSWCMSRKERA